MSTTTNLANRPMQSWWDVVCNCDEENQAHGLHSDIIDYKLFDIYVGVFEKDDTYEWQNDLCTDERFMMWCFMHWACADLGLPEAVEI